VTLGRVALLILLGGIGCSSRPQRPAGPPPEYEPPRVAPWDGGRASDEGDPFADAAEGEWTDEPAETAVPPPAEVPDAAAEAGAPAALDAGDGG
jgi:hypothetical protein